MAANHKVCSRLERRSVIKFLAADKCKPREIHQTICDVYKKAYFSQKNIYEQKMDLPVSD